MPKKSSPRPEPPEAEYRCKYIRGVPTGGQAAAGYKVYISNGKADEGLRLGTVSWEVRRFFDKLLITTPLARWWTLVQSHRFTPICEMMGVNHAGMRPSLKSEQAKVAHTKSAWKSDGGLHLAEWICSTAVLLLCLVDWHRGCRLKQARKAASAMLAEILDNVLGNEKVALLEAHRQPSAEDLAKGCPGGGASGFCCHVKAARSCIAHRGSTGWCLAEEIFQTCIDLGMQCTVVRSWFARLLFAAAAAIDVAVLCDGTTWVQATPEHVAHPMGKNRRRRMDPEVVQLAAKSLVQSGRFRSAAKAAKGLDLGRRQTAQDMEETFMMNYLATTHKQLHNRAFLFLSTDAGRVGGESTLFTVAWSMQAELAAWLAPQVTMLRVLASFKDSCKPLAIASVLVFSILAALPSIPWNSANTIHVECIGY